MTETPGLSDGASLLLWPRHTTEYRAEEECAAVGTVKVRPDGAQPVFQSAADAWLLQRLATLDRMYGGSIPGFLAREGDRLQQMEASVARRRVLSPPQRGRHLLPYSLVRRARAIEALRPARVVLRHDLDGLGLLLSSTVGPSLAVTVVELDERRRAWLTAEMAHWPGSESGLTIVATDEQLQPGAFDLALVHGGHPQHTAEGLAWADTMVEAAGHILMSLYAPWDTAFVEATKAASIDVLDQWREIDVPLLPGGFAVGGSGDIVVMRRPTSSAVALPQWQGGAVEFLEQQPYQWLDFDALALAEPGSLAHLLDTVALYSPRAEFKRSMVLRDGRELATWYDSEGFGFTAELSLEEAHLLVTLLPFSTELDYAVQCAVFHVLGDRFTQIRPQRTVHWRQESIVV